MRIVLVLIGAIFAADAIAGGHAYVGPFFASESVGCSEDCGGALSEEKAQYGASALFVGRSGDIGGVIEVAVTDQEPQAGIGPSAWIGPVRVSALGSVMTDSAEYDLGGGFGSAGSTDRATVYSAEIAWEGIFARYSFYQSSHDFSRTIGNATRSAEADMDVQSVWLGYRHRIW